MTNEAEEPQDAIAQFAALAGTHLIRGVFAAREYQSDLPRELRAGLERRRSELFHDMYDKERAAHALYLAEVRQGADRVHSALFLPMNAEEQRETRPTLDRGEDKRVVPKGWSPNAGIDVAVWDLEGRLNTFNPHARAMDLLNRGVYRYLTERSATEDLGMLVEGTEEALEKAVAHAMPGLVALYDAQDLHTVAGSTRIEATRRGVKGAPYDAKAEAPALYKLSNYFLREADKVRQGWQGQLIKGVAAAVPTLLAGQEPTPARDLSAEPTREAARSAGLRTAGVTRDENTWPVHVSWLAERAGRLAPGLTKPVAQASAFHLERARAVGRRGQSRRENDDRAPEFNGTPLGDPAEIARGRLNPRLSVSADAFWAPPSTAQPPPPEQLVAAGAGFASVTAKATAAVVSADQGVNTVDLDQVRVPTRGQVNELVVEPRL